MKHSIYPVVMCGGSGTRLWPVSRPSRPKQFVPLLGERTLFENTVDRVRGLDGFARLLVVSGESQASFVGAQLPADLPCDVLLEPEGRDSAAAIAAAALFIAELDPDGIAVILASDHHVPDAAAFRAVVDLAAKDAAAGRIVTLGIRPSEPSPAYGYIKPRRDDDPGVSSVRPVEAFVEKPDVETAKRYIADGYLWNSGNFIARADTLIEELSAHAPDVLEQVRIALRERRAGPAGQVLSEAFRDVPKISIDYAVMEPTKRASVVPADIQWSDLGAWDAVHAALPHDADGNASVGPAEVVASRDTLVFNRSNRLCVVEGGDGLNVVVDEDCVFVSTLDRAQQVKSVVEGLKSRGAPEAGTPTAAFDIADASARWSRWLTTHALPLWWTNGFDHQAGIWREELSGDGLPTSRPTRARVQGRQTFCYATAPEMGWPGPGETIVEAGLQAIDRYCDRPPLLTTLVDREGAVLDDRVLLYDQTFHILALAAANGFVEEAEVRALGVLDAIEERFERAGAGFREMDDDPFQSNAHMHLLEACLEWYERGSSQRWSEVAGLTAELAMDRFIGDDGFVREFFDPDWRPAEGEKGEVVEPGHQFEWSWLLGRWGDRTDNRRAIEISRKLFDAGLAGVDPARGLAVDTMNADLVRVTDRARLWPQTEWLKAACLLAERATPETRGEHLEEIGRAHGAFARYLDRSAAGLWFDKCLRDGSFVEEPAPASSFYHIVTAIRQLGRTAGALEATEIR